jgi:hypothetical protein
LSIWAQIIARVPSFRCGVVHITVANSTCPKTVTGFRDADECGQRQLH